jgi:hypothetical protein
MARATHKSKRIPREAPPIHIEHALHFFNFLASLEGEMRARALVDAIAAEPDVDDWSELEAWHKAQRRRRGGRSR